MRAVHRSTLVRDAKHPLEALTLDEACSRGPLGKRAHLRSNPSPSHLLLPLVRRHVSADGASFRAVGSAGATLGDAGPAERVRRCHDAPQKRFYFTEEWISAIYPPGNSTIAASRPSDWYGSIRTVAPEAFALASVSATAVTSYPVVS
jgi:hypothetical protein